MTASQPLPSKTKGSKGSRSIPKTKGNSRPRKTNAKDILMAAANIDFTKESDAKDFEKRYKHKWAQSPANEILFLLANRTQWPPEGVNWPDGKTTQFLKWLLTNYHGLLEVDPGQHLLSPFHLALVHQNAAFVEAVLNYKDLMNRNTILPAKGQWGNALHLAIKNKLFSIDLLIQKCQDYSDMFGHPEPSTGNTPLHACMSLGLAGVEGCDEAGSESDVDYEQNSGTCSDGSVSAVESEDEDEDKSEDGRRNFARRRTYTFEYPLHRNQTNKLCLSTTHNSQVDVTEGLVDVIEKLVEKSPDVLECFNLQGYTPYQERIHQIRNVLLNGAEEDEARLERIVADDPIACWIRTYCVKKFPRDRIMKCLYQTGHERHIEFDLGGLRNETISTEYLNQLSKHLRFESILKYVALPKLTTEASPIRKRAAHRVPHKRGRSDLVTVFRWLRENNVQKIVKVIVLDDRDPCHADSSIEEALQGFEVEIWDWKRVDLSSDVIYKSTAIAKEISLYSSGNSAVLMGWASQQGLPNKDKFPKLEKVHLYIREGYEDEERLTKYINDFKDTIKSSSNISVDHILDNGNVSHTSEFQSSDGFLQPQNQWIDCVVRFSRFLNTASGIRPIKVAIIDDGVDASMISLDGKIAAGKSFCPYVNSDDLMSPYFVSSSNHGTCMAMLICRLCPMVQLYVARLDQKPVMGSNERHITAKSAAKAIRWATECGVDIISMSWTIETPVTDNPDMKSLEDAVRDACMKNTLMFCSTSDQGSLTKDCCYPGDFAGCIRIGSATDTGDAKTWVNVDKVDYLLPGTNVPFSNNEGKTVSHESGSSVATAAASGLAAVLLSASWVLDENDQHFSDDKNMRVAFKNLTMENKYPRVQERLEKRFKDELAKLEKDGGEQRRHYDFSKMIWNENCRKALKEVLLRMKETT